MVHRYRAHSAGYAHTAAGDTCLGYTVEQFVGLDVLGQVQQQRGHLLHSAHRQPTEVQYVQKGGNIGNASQQLRWTMVNGSLKISAISSQIASCEKKL